MNKNSKIEVEIFIPAHESHDRLKVIIKSLIDDYPDVKILIVDSSEIALDCKFDEGIIEYHHCPELSLIDKINKYLGKITTPYILLHPDDEIINPYALDYLRSQLNFYSENVSSTLSQNITLLNMHSCSVVKPRRDSLFAGNSIYCLHHNPTLADCLTPYHQMIWGLHRTSLVKRFFLLIDGLPWDGNICLFERLFNIFMHFHGKVIVSTLPLLLRRDILFSTKKSHIEDIVSWISNYRKGKLSYISFLKKVASRFSNDFELSDKDTLLLLFDALNNDAMYRKKHYHKKFLKYFNYAHSKLHKYFNKRIEYNHLCTYELSQEIRITHSNSYIQKMSKKEFEIFVSTIEPFLRRKYKSILSLVECN